MNIEKILRSLEIYPNIKGYKYILGAMELLQNHPKMNLEDIYPKLENNARNVERAIRYAISQMNVEKFNEIAQTNRTKYSNGEFLYLLLQVI